jgi:FMN phosphatase YigB (HAD superfamily)
VTAGGRGRAGRPLAGVRAVSLDFGNTLVPVTRADLDAVVDALARHAARAWSVDRSAFREAWSDERDRQFREEPPEYREVDLSVRLRRVLARLRGLAPPAPDAPWDDVAAAARSAPGEIDDGLRTYSLAFVEVIRPDPAVTGLLARMAGRGLRLGVLSNWPLAATIDRYVEAAGWSPYLAAVVVSERVGVIKPHPAIFRAAEVALEAPGEALAPSSILHVGDDWAADIVGALGAGWRAGWLRARPGDSPLPWSERHGREEPDLVLDRLGDLEAAIARPG